MPTDATFPYQTDSTGDIATVDGDDFYYNHALQLGLLVADGASGGGATPNDRIELESELRSAFRASPYFEPPIAITPIDSDREAVSLEVEINADNITAFEIPLTFQDQ